MCQKSHLLFVYCFVYIYLSPWLLQFEILINLISQQGIQTMIKKISAVCIFFFSELLLNHFFVNDSYFFLFSADLQTLRFIVIGWQLLTVYLSRSGILNQHQNGPQIILLFLLGSNIFCRKQLNSSIQKCSLLPTLIMPHLKQFYFKDYL